MTCPQCLHKVTVDIAGDGSYVCPNCGHQGSAGGGASSKEGHRMSDSRDVQRLLVEASNAPTIAEAERLVMEAENLRTELFAQAKAEGDVDLANAIIAQSMTPVRVHEHHTAATDWIGTVATAGDLPAIEREMTAQASLWYGRVDTMVKADTDEFTQQAYGMGRRLAGAHGEHADRAESAFLETVSVLYDREAKTGAFKEAASGVPQVGEASYPGDLFSGLAVDPSLPESATTSERAPAIQALEHNGGSSDVVSTNDPGLGQVDNTADAHNGDANTHRSAAKVEGTDGALAFCEACGNPVGDMEQVKGSDNKLYHQGCKKEGNMQHTNCPTCGGHGKVAVRAVPEPSIMDIVSGRRTAASGLDQIQEIADAKDNPASTPMPEEVAWPLIGDGQAQIRNTIGEAESQIAQREQLKGASRQQLAVMAANEVYRRVLAGQDDSGWMGDMGAGGVAPGQQDGGNPPSSNLGQPDPVYGFGGDQGDKALKPYGAGEANDYTNNPGMNWQPGQPTQMDMSGQAGTTGAPNSTQAGPSYQASRNANEDPEIAKALAFVRQRRALLENKA